MKDTYSLNKNIWDKVSKIGISKICGRQPLKNLKGYGLFTWSALEYLVPFMTVTKCIFGGNPVGIYQLKVNNRKTKTRCEICSKLTIKCLYC